MLLTEKRLGPRSPMSIAHDNAPQQSKALGGGEAGQDTLLGKTPPPPRKWCRVQPHSASPPEPQGSRILRIWAVVWAPSTLAQSLPLVKSLYTRPLCHGYTSLLPRESGRMACMVAHMRTLKHRVRVKSPAGPLQDWI